LNEAICNGRLSGQSYSLPDNGFPSPRLNPGTQRALITYEPSEPIWRARGFYPRSRRQNTLYSESWHSVKNTAYTTVNNISNYHVTIQVLWRLLYKSQPGRRLCGGGVWCCYLGLDDVFYKLFRIRKELHDTTQARSAKNYHWQQDKSLSSCHVFVHVLQKHTGFLLIA
jgi:hypothetical protein